MGGTEKRVAAPFPLLAPLFVAGTQLRAVQGRAEAKMDDDEIIAALRACRPRTPVKIAETLDKLYDGGLSQGSMIMFFKRAFPGIPLRLLLDEASSWSRLTSGDLSDDGFNELLKEWIDDGS